MPSRFMLMTLFAAQALFWNSLSAQPLKKQLDSLLSTSCVHCHDGETKTDLNLEQLSGDLSDHKIFRRWVRIFDRVSAGEMPPASEERPDPRQLKSGLAILQQRLTASSLARQKRRGRVPTRRLTRQEYEYTLQDLLHVEGKFAGMLPAENSAGSFDTVGANHRISAVHVRSYLKAADAALDAAIRLGSNPTAKRTFDLVNSDFLNSFHEKPLNLGGNVSRKLKTNDGVVIFRDVDYLLRSDIHGFQVRRAGLYRITVNAEAFQTKTPLQMKVITKAPGGGADLVGAYELPPGKPQQIELEVYLEPGVSFYPTMSDEGKTNEIFGKLAITSAKRYGGRGLAVRQFQVEGPLTESWPPQSTQQIFTEQNLVQSKAGTAIKVGGDPAAKVKEIVTRLAPRFFRRPAASGELAPFVKLASPAIKDQLDFASVIRIPLRSMLSSPQFLLFGGKPRQLDDYALANRLSYFLWKSMPDEELFQLAAAGKLGKPDVLKQQVDRMLKDQKSERFVTDFIGQWLQLNQINATTPDEKLYPEYDELLGRALPLETHQFFRELLDSDLPIQNLVDSDFTFVNRRLAKHYGLPEVEGQQLRKVTLPKASPRGGILTQAAILKTTANGTVTSPVMRGNFVLTNLLGTPPSPPPPDVGSIEPDTRGKTTIREILTAHRELETCAKCHKKIDPPGFALESFDPIGGFRSHYRSTSSGLTALFRQTSYGKGPKVDPSGVTENGRKFKDIHEFKKHLLLHQEQIARNFISKVVVYSTGGEIQFADREAIEELVKRTAPRGYPIRTIIHEVVQSPLFRNK